MWRESPMSFTTLSNAENYTLAQWGFSVSRCFVNGYEFYVPENLETAKFQIRLVPGVVPLPNRTSTYP